MNLIPLKNFPSEENFEQWGLIWHQNNYIANELIQLSKEQTEAYYQAALRAYDMYVQAAQYVIDNNLFFELGIPFNMVELIKASWENDVHWHIYGRFDFAGGVDNIPIKLLEFNANTPTSLFETAFVQYELARINGLDTNAQFNTAYEALVNNFKRLISLDEDVSEVNEIDFKILFSSVKDAEEELTLRFLMQAAMEAGFECEFAYIEDVELDPENGVFYENVNYEYFFTLLPWEIIATDEPDMLNILTQMIKNQVAIILNPAYTLLFQSKGMLKILSDLFPKDEMILKADFIPLNSLHVKKPFFGREGANVSICNENGEALEQNQGDYSDGRFVYQEYATMAANQSYNYQAGVFYAYEPCALGFRRERGIIGNKASFVGHIIKE